jgi:hypothetical protein
MGWNLVIVLPVVAWMNRTPGAWLPIANANTPVREGYGFGPMAAVYALAIVVWFVGKRRCLAGAATRRRHAAA